MVGYLAQGLGQLFELYFFSIYKTFGQREAFSGCRSQDSYCKLIEVVLSSFSFCIGIARCCRETYCSSSKVPIWFTLMMHSYASRYMSTGVKVFR